MKEDRNSHFLLLICSICIVLMACSKKAGNEEERREMIIGTWKAQTRGAPNFIDSRRFHIMEYTKDGRYRELEYNGRENSWNSADTAGMGSLFYEVNDFITFQDSVYYKINDGEIIYHTEKSVLPYPNFVPYEKEIKWIKPGKMKIAGHKEYKYEKI